MLKRMLELSGFYCRMTCFFCGKDFKPDSLKWVLHGQDIDSLPVCNDCGEADLETLHKRFQKRIKSLRSHVDWLESLQAKIDNMATDVSLVQEIISPNSRYEDWGMIYEDGLKYARDLIDKGLA